MERAGRSGLRRESAGDIEDPGVPDGGSADVAVRLRGVAGVSLGWRAFGGDGGGNGAVGDGVGLLGRRRGEGVLEEAKVERVATVMRRRGLEWFGHVKRIDETENIRSVVEMKMEGKRPRGRLQLR